MDFEIDKPRDNDFEKSPQDNLKFQNNNNYIGNEGNYANNNNLINEDNDLEYNRNEYPDGMKEEVSQNDSQRLEEQERTSNLLFKGFIVKVYGILSVQLFITLFLILLFQTNSIKSYFLSRPGFTGFLILVSIIGYFFTLFLLSANENLGKKVPYNYLLLFTVTLFMSLMCALIAVSYSFSVVLFCILLTIISSITITIYAYSTDRDFSYIKVLCAVLISQFGGFIFTVFMLDITMLEKVCLFVATLLFGVYLVYDTQVILKKYGEVYSIDDYIFASLQIYIDIARLFLAILATIGKSSKN